MAESRSLLARLLDRPDLSRIVPELQPRTLHRVIERCGLEDCAELVALITPEQLAQIFDLDLWRAQPGVGDQKFDTDRFALWIAVLMQSGAAAAAEKVMGLDIELAVEGVARLARVFDAAAISDYTTLDGEPVQGRAMDGLALEIGGYVLQIRRPAEWEAIGDLLTHLHTERSDYFHRLMRGCVGLSDGPREPDGFHELQEAAEQHTFDLARERDARREEQGYVGTAEARAFLQAARALRLDVDKPSPDPIARAYLRANGPADIVELLDEAGGFTPRPAGLLGAGAGAESRLSLIDAHVASHPASGAELAFLANVLVAGCSLQGRPFTVREGSDGAAATCNLGLEHWPSKWPEPDLTTAFQIGWTILQRDVCTFAATSLAGVLAGMACGDRDIQLRLDGLRRELVRHTRDGQAWRARHALEAILMLDAQAWAGLLGLIDECPVSHAALRPACKTIEPADFDFFSATSQIEAVRRFVASLPALLVR